MEPVSVEIRERADMIWLTNTSAAPIQAQVRVYRWSQDATGDRLDPTDALLASPPIVRIAPGGRQLVRLVLTAPAACEDAFRLAINEVPAPAPPGGGLRYVLHYSVPVFASPKGCQALAPQLDWRLEPATQGVRLVIANTGGRHAQIARLAYTDVRGRRTELTGGLLGYVLPGQTRPFTFEASPAVFAGGGTVETLVNGQTVKLQLALHPAAR